MGLLKLLELNYSLIKPLYKENTFSLNLFVLHSNSHSHLSYLLMKTITVVSY